MTKAEKEKIRKALVLLHKRNQSGQSLLLKRAIEILEGVLCD
jgi:hypothetical protein